MGECENLKKCGFCKKYGDSKSLAVKGFIAMYCQTDKQSECKRKEYKVKNGILPTDDMMPNGAIIRK